MTTGHLTVSYVTVKAWRRLAPKRPLITSRIHTMTFIHSQVSLTTFVT